MVESAYTGYESEEALLAPSNAWENDASSSGTRSA